MAEGAVAASADRAARVENLLKGAVDLHIHSGPSVMPRRLDHAVAAVEADEAGMRAVLFKEHYYPTIGFPEVIRGLRPDLKVEMMSGIVLNNSVGGLNPFALEHALKLGARLVWMPTISAENHLRFGFRKEPLQAKTPMRQQVAITVLDARRQLTDAAKECLDLIAEHDAALAGGHLHVSELFPLFEEAARRGVKRRFVNHPSYQIGCTFEDMRSLVSMGVRMEQSVCMFVECESQFFDPDHLRDLIDAVGPQNTFFGSDLGQAKNPFNPAEGFRRIIGVCMDLGYSDEEIRLMVATNAAELIGLDERPTRRVA